MKKFILGVLVLLVGCSAQDINKNADTEDKASLVSLTRVYQRVIRYSCEGSVTSDKVETTGSPVALINIQPQTRTNIYSSDFDNLTLNTSAGCIVDHAEFNVDYSYGWCNMRVASGTNQIRYRFYYCDQWTTKYDENGNASQVCTAIPVLREEGSTWIRVSYDEIHKPEVLEVRPSVESCQKPPSP